MSTLAAARADNFYYPPGWTPQKGSLNKYHGQHALRERARKLDQGILIIRFEMPFHVWCGGCASMIAKGVRFNAEKKQIGNYYSTKIWSFKMKSACCQHQIEIHTDPKNCDYVVVSGGEKKTVEYDAEDAGTATLATEEEREQLADPMCRVEHEGAGARKAAGVKPELVRLKQASDVRHSDPWRINSRLRAQLRSQKQRVAAEEHEARAKGLGIRLLPSQDEDRLAASSAAFRPRFEMNLRERRAVVRASSIFSTSCGPSPSPVDKRKRCSGEVGRRSRGQEGGQEEVKAREVSGSACAAGSRLFTSTAQQGQRKGQAGGGGGGGGEACRVKSAGSGLCRVDDRAKLAAKRRRIDAQGVLAAALGKV